MIDKEDNFSKKKKNILHCVRNFFGSLWSCQSLTAKCLKTSFSKRTFRPSLHESENVLIRNFLFADSASLDTYPVYPAYESNRNVWDRLSRVEISENAYMNQESCGH